MDSQNNKLTALFDLSQTISSETSLLPLLTKVLERLMFHANYSCGMVLNSTQTTDSSVRYQVKLIKGDTNDGYMICNSNSCFGHEKDFEGILKVLETKLF